MRAQTKMPKKKGTFTLRELDAAKARLMSGSAVAVDARELFGGLDSLANVERMFDAYEQIGAAPNSPHNEGCQIVNLRLRPLFESILGSTKLIAEPILQNWRPRLRVGKKPLPILENDKIKINACLYVGGKDGCVVTKEDGDDATYWEVPNGFVVLWPGSVMSCERESRVIDGRRMIKMAVHDRDDLFENLEIEAQRVFLQTNIMAWLTYSTVRADGTRVEADKERLEALLAAQSSTLGSRPDLVKNEMRLMTGAADADTAIDIIDARALQAWERASVEAQNEAHAPRRAPGMTSGPLFARPASRKRLRKELFKCRKCGGEFVQAPWADCCVVATKIPGRVQDRCIGCTGGWYPFVFDV